jgi:SAM-dependent methyltransferase
MPTEPNAYSERWFEFFHAAIPESRTKQETEFICASAPLPSFRRILDVGCGLARHARALCDRGYSVTGIDSAASVIDKARESAGGPTYLLADIRDFQPDAGAFDAAIVMSQTFGHFDPETNRDLLRRLADGVRPGGRLVLDVWSPEFFAAHQGPRQFETAGGTVRERKYVSDGRLFVHLDYPDGAYDDFEWQLFTPAEMATLATSIGCAVLVCCTDHDAFVAPSPAKPRLQFVLERC